MSINAVSNNSNVNLAKKVSATTTAKPVEAPKKAETKVQAQGKDTFVKSTAKDVAPKTYNASGKVSGGNSQASLVAQSMAVQAHTSVANTKPVEAPKKSEATTSKVQAVAKSIDARV
jgi:hypothetical protein